MPPNLRELSQAALLHLQEAGQRSLPLDDEARDILRTWYRHAKEAERQPLPPHTKPDTSARSRPAAAPAGGSPRRATKAADESPRPSQEAEPNQAAPQSVEEKLAYLRQRAENWKAARALGSLRDTMVFACGNPHARLMLVGEAPGFDEERLREPFVGKAGQKLNGILKAMGLSREEIYISNICKWRPAMGEQQGSANRPPNEAEIAACLPLVLAEIRAIRPACIICLGGTAAKGLLGSASSVSSLRGKWLDCQGIPTRVTYHPSYLLRNESIKARRDVWEDMLAAMRQLGIAVSAKQEHYFQEA